MLKSLLNLPHPKPHSARIRGILVFPGLLKLRRGQEYESILKHARGQEAFNTAVPICVLKNIFYDPVTKLLESSSTASSLDNLDWGSQPKMTSNSVELNTQNASSQASVVFSKTLGYPNHLDSLCGTPASTRVHVVQKPRTRHY